MFDDDDPEAALALRVSPVGLAQVSNAVQRKYQTKQSGQGFPFLSMSTLFDDFATLCMNRVALANKPNQQFLVATQATSLQRHIFDILGVNPSSMFLDHVQF